ncbi:MAG: 4Fe-4S binding protein [Sporomusaceae bacterium]|nr:4Fe-4S binding protein [Sporomusaceae bacterium]
MVAKRHRVTVEERLCKGCGICVHFCPAKILELTPVGKIKVIDGDKCMGCKACEHRCPDFALSVEERE